MQANAKIGRAESKHIPNFAPFSKFAPLMTTLIEDISQTLSEAGLRHCIAHTGLLPDGYGHIICTSASGGSSKAILPVNISARTPNEASQASQMYAKADTAITESLGERPIIITQDRWERQRKMMKARLLAHLGIFTPAYARNCEVRRIGKEEAADFLARSHSYGDAACRYRYGMFLRRHTGHLASIMNGTGQQAKDILIPGTLVAVAEFSNARKWTKGGKEIKSYEWTRYASLPGIRVCGGMGKMLRTFMQDVKPDDIMSYADIEWSDGNVYESLGFTKESTKDPVFFTIDSSTYERTALRTSGDNSCGAISDGIPGASEPLYFKNWGSYKYRLKITDYQ